MPVDQATRTRQSEARRMEAGARRMPGGMLTAEAAEALDDLLRRGAPSKAAAINAALVAAVRRGGAKWWQV